MSRGQRAATVNVREAPKRKKKGKKYVREFSYFELAERKQAIYRTRRCPLPIAPEPLALPPPPIIEDLKAKRRCCVWLKRACIKTPPISFWKLSPHALKAVQALALTPKQVRRLHERFEDMDTFGQGQITRAEFWEEIGVVPSAFTNKLFEMIDVDNSGRIDFSVRFCLLPKNRKYILLSYIRTHFVVRNSLAFCAVIAYSIRKIFSDLLLTVLTLMVVER